MNRAGLLAAALVLLGSAGAAFGHTDHSAVLAATGTASFFTLGLLLGLGHALDGDHLAAVAAMIDRKAGRRAMAARGALWGLGHTFALMLICSAVLLLGLSVSHRVEAALELAVGLMIVALGLRVLWRMRRERIHLHVHSHDDTRHIHLHSHAGDPKDHRRASHDHRHARGALGTLGVGLLHGAAGSAGLVVLAVAAADSTAQALGYFAAFGIGTMLGMTALTIMASWPLERLQNGAVWMQQATGLAIAGFAILVGGSLSYASFSAF